MSSSEDKCEVSKDKHEDRRKMEYFREAINSAEGRKGKSKPPLGGASFSTCSVSMTGTLLPDERAQAVRSLGSLLNYVRLDPRKGYVENPGPQGKLGFPDFPPITEIDGANFDSHNPIGRLRPT
ncbi:hypothetical protein DY000_02007363 [Brassica cretica]|uniref:Uncharacterized protein n=1 Tax=Brassica cretica TaxID=69181 RepID=A0ABQ7BZ76_BRACR|nr:hypothetical protein DY000_02007363 [Brassica cretica]